MAGLPRASPRLLLRRLEATPKEPILYWIGTPDQPFDERVLESVQGDAQETARAEEVVGDLLMAADGGENVSLPGSPGDAAADATLLVSLATDLQEAANGARGKPASLTSGWTVTTTAHAAALAIPGDFKIRGYPETIYTWFFRMEIDAGYCSSNDCEVTDKVRQTWRLNPGRTGDVFSWTSRYAPNTGLLENIYANGYVYCGSNFTLCGGDLLGEGGARDGTGSGSSTISHDSNAGSKLVDAVRLRATLVPNSQRYYDFARTGTAYCGTGTNRNCIFGDLVVVSAPASPPVDELPVCLAHGLELDAGGHGIRVLAHTLAVYRSGLCFTLNVIPESLFEADELPDFRGHAAPGDEHQLFHVRMASAGGWEAANTNETIFVLTGTSLPRSATTRLWVPTILPSEPIGLLVSWPHAGLEAFATLDGTALVAAQRQASV